MSDAKETTMNAPERIWVDWKKANQGFLAYDEAPSEPFSDCRDAYVRADLLAAAEARVGELEFAIKAKGGTEHYPTLDAYLRACEALTRHKDRADAAETALAQARADTAAAEARVKELERLLENARQVERNVQQAREHEFQRAEKARADTAAQVAAALEGAARVADRHTVSVNFESYGDGWIDAAKAIAAAIRATAPKGE